MQDFPSLPSGGLGILALSASFSLIAMTGAVLMSALKKRWGDVIWGIAPLGLLVLTMLFGGQAPRLHSAGAIFALALVLRNALLFEGVARWASVVAAAACTNAIAVALWLF